MALPTGGIKVISSLTWGGALWLASHAPNAGHHLPAQSQREGIPEGLVNLWGRVRCMAVLDTIIACTSILLWIVNLAGSRSIGVFIPGIQQPVGELIMPSH